MPYELMKSRGKKEGYYVITKGTREKHSKRPLSLEKAKAQMKALYAAEGGYKIRGGMVGGGYYEDYINKLVDDRRFNVIPMEIKEYYVTLGKNMIHEIRIKGLNKAITVIFSVLTGLTVGVLAAIPTGGIGLGAGPIAGSIAYNLVTLPNKQAKQTIASTIEAMLVSYADSNLSPEGMIERFNSEVGFVEETVQAIDDETWDIEESELLLPAEPPAEPPVEPQREFYNPAFRIRPHVRPPVRPPVEAQRVVDNPVFGIAPREEEPVEPRTEFMNPAFEVLRKSKIKKEFPPTKTREGSGKKKRGGSYYHEVYDRTFGYLPDYFFQY